MIHSDESDPTGRIAFSQAPTTDSGRNVSRKLLLASAVAADSYKSYDGSSASRILAQLPRLRRPNPIPKCYAAAAGIAMTIETKTMSPVSTMGVDSREIRRHFHACGHGKGKAASVTMRPQSVEQGVEPRFVAAKDASGKSSSSEHCYPSSKSEMCEGKLKLILSQLRGAVNFAKPRTSAGRHDRYASFAPSVEVGKKYSIHPARVASPAQVSASVQTSSNPASIDIMTINKLMRALLSRTANTQSPVLASKAPHHRHTSKYTVTHALLNRPDELSSATPTPDAVRLVQPRSSLRDSTITPKPALLPTKLADRMRTDYAVRLLGFARRVIDKVDTSISKRPAATLRNEHMSDGAMDAHPINVAIGLINAFTAVGFRMKSRFENNKAKSALMLSLADFLCIPISKTQLAPEVLRSREFSSGVKERLLQALYKVVNAENGIEAKQQAQQYLCYIGKGNNSILVRTVLTQRGGWKTARKCDIPRCNFVWTQWKRAECFLPGKEQEWRVYNHLEQNQNLSNKKEMFCNMKRYYEGLGMDPFRSIPLTFHITAAGDNAEYMRFSTAFTQCKCRKGESVWIVKPGEYTNRGNGIMISNSLAEMRSAVDQSSDEGRTFIFQKYIEHPLLINKRKFDIRSYALCTSINKRLKGYFYREGYIRTSSSEFSLKSLGNRMVHLTNDAVQIHSAEYGKYEAGNKLAFADLQKYLDTNYPDRHVDVERDIVSQMERLVTDSIRAVRGRLDGEKVCDCIEVLSCVGRRIDIRVRLHDRPGFQRAAHRDQHQSLSRAHLPAPR